MGQKPPDRDLGAVAPAWLALVALTAVVGLSLASIGLALGIGHQTAERTAEHRNGGWSSSSFGCIGKGR